MSELEKILETISDLVNRYNNEILTDDELRDLSRKLSTNMYYLGELKLDYKKKWLDCYFANKAPSASGKSRSNAECEKLADQEIPEYWMINSILERAKAVSISVSDVLKSNQ